MNIEEFVKINIAKINEKITDFKEKYGKLFTDIEIKNYLQDKFKNDIQDKLIINKLLKELENNNFKKSKISDIANKYGYYKAHLEKFYKTSIFNKIFTNFNRKEIVELIIKT